MSEDRELLCPQCESPFEEREVEGVTIDYCLLCGGVWLDPGELDELTGYKKRRSRTESTTSTHDDAEHLDVDDGDDDDDEESGGILGFVSDALSGSEHEDVDEWDEEWDGGWDSGDGDGGDGGGGWGGGGDGGGGGGE